MARKDLQQGGRVRWRTIIIPFSTVQFWVSFLMVMLALAVVMGLLYYQFFSPKAQARRLIVRAEKQFDQAIVMGVKELAYEDYRSIQESLFQARKAFDDRKHTDSIILSEQTMTTLEKAMDRLRSDEYFRRERSASMGNVRGTVEVQVAGSLEWEGARKGVNLKKGDKVRTRGGSSCVVQFDDGSQLTIKSDSLVHIDDLSEDVRTHTKNSAIKLLVSDVEASILRPTTKGSRFLIETPGSVAQVMKARMNIRVNRDNETEYQLLSGDVSVNAGGRNVALSESEVVRLGTEGKVMSRGRLLGVPEPRSPENLLWVTSREKNVPMTFAWRDIPEAESYRLVISTDRYFTNVVYDDRQVRGSVAGVRDLGPGLYYWRVASVDSKGKESLFSTFRVFRISQDSTPPFFAMNDLIVLSQGDSGRIYLSGAVEPESQLFINGRAAPMGPDGSFRIFSDLTPYQTSLQIKARDNAGNELTQVRDLR